MASKKVQVQKVGRWLRVGVLSLSVLGPFINILASRVRSSGGATADAVNNAVKGLPAIPQGFVESSADLHVQERLLAVKTALNDLLSGLGDSPAARDLRKRSDDFSADLKQQSNRLSRSMVERSNLFSQGLRERGSRFSQDLLQNSRNMSRDIAEQKRSFWIAFGFGIGLTAAGIVTYVSLRQRMLRSQEPAEDDLIQLRYEGVLASDQMVGQPGGSIVSIHGDSVINHTVNGRSSEKKAFNHSTHKGRPEDAKLIGVTSTRVYYPVDTSLEQLVEMSSEPVEVIYFSSVEEAEAQGFTAV